MLWPNRKNGHSYHASDTAKHNARYYGYMAVFEALGVQQLPAYHAICITYVFHAATRRRYDLDNALAACKPTQDGIADALHIDDCEFSPVTIVRGELTDPAQVVVTIEVMA